MRPPHEVVFRPLITEKSNLAKEKTNQVVFEVDRGSNKVEIRQAVEKAFKVKVLDVRTVNVMGKKKRVGKTVGRRSDWKKAMVTLAPGEHIEFFEGV
ncbi:MAG: 50S ribosomal protein L23 [Deltaproteobacteria bacterium]|nr:50S ribosomal protein L23 [Deltaproteobacteria bacterium]